VYGKETFARGLFFKREAPMNPSGSSALYETYPRKCFSFRHCERSEAISWQIYYVPVLNGIASSGGVYAEFIEAPSSQ
jgi:hypothetical protein